MQHNNDITTRVSITLLICSAVCLHSRCIAADGRIAVRVVDAAGEVTPVRAWVDAGEQRLFKPVTPDTATPYIQDSSFSCDGWFTMIVPAGRAIVHVEKGKEFVPVDVEVEVLADQTIEQSIRIECWIDMAATGWYSADLHVHLGHDDSRVLRQLALADDVHLVPSFTYWLRGRGETWNAKWPDDSFTQPIVIDDRHLIIRNNIEIERINRDAAPGCDDRGDVLVQLESTHHRGELR